MTTPRSPLFLNVREAAEMFGVSPERLARAIAAGQVRAITIGVQKLIPRAAILKLAAGDGSKDA